MLNVFADPEVFERLERIDSQAIEPSCANYERATIELLDAWRAAEAGDPDAQGAVALAGRGFRVEALARISVGSSRRSSGCRGATGRWF
jgi:hypothetical protein